MFGSVRQMQKLSYNVNYITMCRHESMINCKIRVKQRIRYYVSRYVNFILSKLKAVKTNVS